MLSPFSAPDASPLQPPISYLALFMVSMIKTKGCPICKVLRRFAKPHIYLPKRSEHNYFYWRWWCVCDSTASQSRLLLYDYARTLQVSEPGVTKLILVSWVSHQVLVKWAFEYGHARQHHAYPRAGKICSQWKVWIHCRAVSVLHLSTPRIRRGKLGPPIWSRLRVLCI